MKSRYARPTCRLTMLIVIGLMVVAGFSVCPADQNGLTFAVISDHRDNLASLPDALTFIAGQQADLLLVPGDFSPLLEAYPNYYVEAGFTVEGLRDSNSPGICFVVGNHDDPPDGDGFFRQEVAPYYPDNGPPGAPAGTIFSFDRGNAHFVVTNQYWRNHQGGYNEQQLDWLERDLQSSSQPFKFVIGHEPAFPLYRHVGDSLDADPANRDTFWKILADNGVYAFFCGHTHHLSIIKRQGVYQINSGVVVGDHISVVVVEVSEIAAVARLYETDGASPQPEDNIFTISLEDGGADDDLYQVVFSSDYQPADGEAGCFIQSVVRNN